MAKVCPITKEKVLYLECLECEYRNKCKETSLPADVQPANIAKNPKKNS